MERRSRHNLLSELNAFVYTEGALMKSLRAYTSRDYSDQPQDGQNLLYLLAALEQLFLTVLKQVDII